MINNAQPIAYQSDSLSKIFTLFLKKALNPVHTSYVLFAVSSQLLQTLEIHINRQSFFECFSGFFY